MNDDYRGKIRNREAAGQLKDFSGLRYGKITPTDIDGFADFQNKAFVIFEVKYGTAPVPYGQRLALERLADACEAGGVRSLVIVAHHQVKMPADINVAELPATKVRMKGKWIKPNVPHTVKSAFDSFLVWVEKENKKA